MSDVSNNNNNNDDDDDDDDEEEEDDEDIINDDEQSACLALLGSLARPACIASCEVRAITTGAHPVYDLIFLTEGGGGGGGGLGRVRSYRFGALRQFNETLASSPAVRGKPMAAKFPATNAKSKFLGLSSAEVEARRAQLQAWLQELLDDVRPRMPLMLRHAALHFFNFDEALFFGENLPPAAADGTSTGASGGGFEIGSGGETTRSAAAAAAAVAGGAGASGGAAALEKRGYMAKEGHLVKNWKLRYFELGWELPLSFQRYSSLGNTVHGGGSGGRGGGGGAAEGSGIAVLRYFSGYDSYRRYCDAMDEELLDEEEEDDDELRSAEDEGEDDHQGGEGIRSPTHRSRLGSATAAASSSRSLFSRPSLFKGGSFTGGGVLGGGGWSASSSAARFSFSGGARFSFSPSSQGAPAGSIPLAGSTMSSLTPAEESDAWRVDTSAVHLLTPQGVGSSGSGSGSKKVAYAFPFELRAADGTVYPLRCSSAEDRAAWMQAIQAAAIASTKTGSGTASATAGPLGPSGGNGVDKNDAHGGDAAGAAVAAVAAATVAKTAPSSAEDVVAALSSRARALLRRNPKDLLARRLLLLGGNETSTNTNLLNSSETTSGLAWLLALPAAPLLRFRVCAEAGLAAAEAAAAMAGARHRRRQQQQQQQQQQQLSSTEGAAGLVVLRSSDYSAGGLSSSSSEEQRRFFASIVSALHRESSAHPRHPTSLAGFDWGSSASGSGSHGSATLALADAGVGDAAILMSVAASRNFSSSSSSSSSSSNNGSNDDDDDGNDVVPFCAGLSRRQRLQLERWVVEALLPRVVASSSSSSASSSPRRSNYRVLSLSAPEEWRRAESSPTSSSSSLPLWPPKKPPPSSSSSGPVEPEFVDAPTLLRLLRQAGCSPKECRRVRAHATAAMAATAAAAAAAVAVTATASFDSANSSPLWRDWPAGRAVILCDEEEAAGATSASKVSVAVLVGFEDHLRFVSTDRPARRVGDAFLSLRRSLELFEAAARGLVGRGGGSSNKTAAAASTSSSTSTSSEVFATHGQWGYLTSSPQRLGTAMSAAVVGLPVPHLRLRCAPQDLLTFALNYGLVVTPSRGTRRPPPSTNGASTNSDNAPGEGGGEEYEYEYEEDTEDHDDGMCVDIAPTRTMYITEGEVATRLFHGVRLLTKKDRTLGGGKPAPAPASAAPAAPASPAAVAAAAALVSPSSPSPTSPAFGSSSENATAAAKGKGAALPTGKSSQQEAATNTPTSGGSGLATVAAALSGEERKARLLKFRESLEDGVSVVKFNRRGGVAMRKLFLVGEHTLTWRGGGSGSAAKKKAKGGGELYDLREMHRVLRGEDEEQIDDGGAGDSTVVAGGGAARLLGTPTLRSHVEKQPTVRSLRDGGMCASLVFRQRSVDFGVDSKPLRDSLAVGFQLLFEDVAKDKGSKATTKRK